METMASKSRIATIEQLGGRWIVHCGFTTRDPNETIPARHFKRKTTCSNDYATKQAAIKAAEGFLNG